MINKFLKGFKLLFLISFFYSQVHAQVWNQKNSLPYSPRYNSGSFVIGDTAYLCMGLTSTWQINSDLWAYDYSSDTWMQKASFIGSPSTAVVSFTIGGEGYVGMGWDGSNVLRNIYKYNPQSNSWTFETSYPGSGGRNSMGVSCQGKAYIFGGGNNNGVSSGEFWEYDPVSSLWTQIQSVPIQARTNFVGLELDSLIYFGMGHNQSIDFDDLWSYNPTTNNWKQLANLPGAPRVEPVAVVVDGKIVIGGGKRRSNSTFLSDYYMFDPHTNTWSAISGFNKGKRTFATTFNVGGKGYVIGGRDSAINALSDVWEIELISTGKAELSKPKNEDWKVYPSITKDIITIDFKEELEVQIATISIYNSSGKILLDDELNWFPFELSLKRFSNGVYLYVIDDGRKKKSGKVILSK